MKVSRRLIRLIITIAVGIILLIISHYIGITRPIENILSAGAAPIQRSFYNMSTRLNKWYHNKNDVGLLHEEINALEQRISILLQKQVDLEELQRENQSLKSMLEFKEQDELEVKTASIIGRTTEGLQQTYIINVGERDGMRVGLPIIVFDGIMVGKIIKTHEKTSMIRLITDNESKVAASILNQDRTIGLVTGQYNRHMHIDMIPQGELIYEDNLVITSGIEDAIPRGLILGAVDTTMTQEGDLFQSAVIRPVISYDRIVEVAIIMPNDEQEEVTTE